MAAGEKTAEPEVAILGSGSDYTVFFNHIGIPSVDMLFDGPYGVYHSAYDSHEWMKRHGDPGFAYHAAMARLWGVMALRLANADAMPFDFADLRARPRRLHRRPGGGGQGKELRPGPAARPAPRPADSPRFSRLAARGGGSRHRRAPAPRRARPAGAGRDPRSAVVPPLVYAPLPSYAAETLPGVREAVLAGDSARAAQQAAVLADAIRRVADRLKAPAP